MEAYPLIWPVVRALETGTIIVGWVKADTVRIVFPGIDAHVDVWTTGDVVLFTRAVVLGTDCHGADSPVATAIDAVLDLPHVNRTLAPHVAAAVQSAAA